jgi:putative cell wall-binding protein
MRMSVLGRVAGAAIGLAVVAATVVIGAPPSSAQASPDADLVASYDSAAFVASKGVVLTGWVIDLNHPAENSMLVTLTETTGSTTRDHFDETEATSIARTDVARNYPAAGANHGFAWVVGYDAPGTHRYCLSVSSLHHAYTAGDHDKYFEKPIGCRTVTVPAEVTAGEIDAFGPDATSSGIAFSGWAASNYGQPGSVTDSTGTHAPDYLLEAVLSVIPDAGGAASSRTLSLSSSKTADPSASLQPARTFSGELPLAAGDRVSGVYKLCVSMLSEAPPRSAYKALGCSSAHLVGSAGTLERTTPPTTRAAGDDRYATAVAVSRHAFPDSGAGAPIVFLASGAAFPDALAAGPAAAVSGGPLLLTTATRLPSSVAAEIKRLHPQKIVIVGGVGAVSAAVQTAAAGLAPTVRVSGADRYATARAIAEYAFPTGASHAFIASGASYPDALAAGAAAGAVKAPVLLTTPAATSATTALRDELRRLGVTGATIVGGTGAVSSAVQAVVASASPVERVGGATRDETAELIASASFSKADTVYLASDRDFPDGLAASAAGGLASGPVLIFNGCVPTGVIEQLTELQAQHVVIVGGVGALDRRADTLLACA